VTGYQMRAHETQVPIRGPALSNAALAHENQTVKVSESDRLIGELPKQRRGLPEISLDSFFPSINDLVYRLTGIWVSRFDKAGIAHPRSLSRRRQASTERAAHQLGE
jgi:hypothetical protein